MSRFDVRKTFRQRIIIEMIMIFAWAVTSPALKEFYNLLGPAFWGAISIYAMFVHLGQRTLRLKYSVQELFKLTLALDIVYFTCMSMLVYNGDMKNILLFELIYDAPYMTVVFATIHKMENLAFDKWSGDRRDKIESKIENSKRIVTILSVGVGASLSYVIPIYGLLTIQLIFIFIGITLTIRSLRS